MPSLAPDLLDEDLAELLAELLGPDALHKRLTREHALLRVLDVVVGARPDEALHAAGPHLALHDRQRPLQVPVPHLHHDAPGLLHLPAVPCLHRRRPRRRSRGREPTRRPCHRLHRSLSSPPAAAAPMEEDDDEDCHSYCGSSSSVLCEDACGDDAAASRAPLPFDLNLPPPFDAAAEADQMGARYDTLLRL